MCRPPRAAAHAGPRWNDQGDAPRRPTPAPAPACGSAERGDTAGGDTCGRDTADGELAWLGSLGVVLAGGSVGTGWAVLLGLLAFAVVACLLGRTRMSRQT